MRPPAILACLYSYSPMKSFGIGLLGCGTIGSGVVEVLHRQRELIRLRTGFDLRLVAVAEPTPLPLAPALDALAVRARVLASLPPALRDRI